MKENLGPSYFRATANGRENENVLFALFNLDVEKEKKLRKREIIKRGR